MRKLTESGQLPHYTVCKGVRLGLVAEKLNAHIDQARSPKRGRASHCRLDIRTCRYDKIDAGFLSPHVGI